MSFQIKPVHDIPEKDVKLLGHNWIVENLKEFLESQNMITPLSIAIHGEWGSGKTSIMQTLSSKLDPEKFETMFFEAWKYEYANPSLGLISELTEKFARGNQALITSIIRAALYVLSNQYLSLDPEEVIKIIKLSKHSTETLSTQLSNTIKSNIGDKKLIIIIDDLDRCDVENTLQLLAIIKLFLDMEKCICVAAVDFNRLKQAWRKKYGVTGDNNKEDGSEYLDKIFQIRIGIPRPSNDDIAAYVGTLTNNMPPRIAALFPIVLPKNPRAIKRILNLISYRLNLIDSYYKEFTVIFWTLLEDMIGNTGIIQLHDMLESNGSSLGHLIANLGDKWEQIRDPVQNFVNSNALIGNMEVLKTFFLETHLIALEFEITSDIIDIDFQTLRDATNEVIRSS